MYLSIHKKNTPEYDHEGFRDLIVGLFNIFVLIRNPFWRWSARGWQASSEQPKKYSALDKSSSGGGRPLSHIDKLCCLGSWQREDRHRCCSVVFQHHIPSLAMSCFFVTCCVLCIKHGQVVAHNASLGVVQHEVAAVLVTTGAPVHSSFLRFSLFSLAI